MKTELTIDIDYELLKIIDNLPLNERLERLKARYFETSPQLASERGTYYAESWRETEGQPIQLRIAKAVKKVLENILDHLMEVIQKMRSDANEIIIIDNYGPSTVTVLVRLKNER